MEKERIICGLIVEYNPFHNGHIHHIKAAREKTNCDVLIAVMSGNISQRGEIMCIDKYERTKIALQHGVDLIVELPVHFVLQDASYFAQGALEILSALKATHLCFGSESNDITTLESVATKLMTHADQFNTLIKSQLIIHKSYPMAYQAAIQMLCQVDTIKPNDTLGIAYLVANNALDTPLTVTSIARTNHYHSLDLSYIASATAIRHALINQQAIAAYTPMHHLLSYNQDIAIRQFQLLRYIINIMSTEELRAIHLIDHGIEALFKKTIKTVDTLEDFIKGCQSNIYTTSKIQRSLMQVLLLNHLDNQKADIDYLNILGFNIIGQHHLKSIDSIRKVVRYTDNQSALMDLQIKADILYYQLTTNLTTVQVKKQLYASTPIIIKQDLN